MSRRNIENKLLEIFSPEDLDELVDKRLEEGARSKHSALNKILRENDERDVLVSDKEGYYLTSYVRSRDDSKRHAFMNGEGPFTIAGEDVDISTLNRWDPVSIKNVAKKQRLSTSSTWMEATDDTVIEVQENSTLPAIDSLLSDPGDINGGGLYVVRAFVRWVNKIPEGFDENNNPTGYYPVIDGDTVNLKLVLTDDEHNCSVKVRNIEHLRELMGIQDISWVNEDIEELKDMLKNTLVVAFGGGNNKVGGDTVTPFVQLRDFGFIEEWGY